MREKFLVNVDQGVPSEARGLDAAAAQHPEREGEEFLREFFRNNAGQYVEHDERHFHALLGTLPVAQEPRAQKTYLEQPHLLTDFHPA